jgi:predicted nucleic acid-binding protein
MPDHVHHAPARAWFAAEQVPFATTPITQGTLIRLLMLLAGQSFAAALSALTQVVALPRHRFWPDAIGYHDVRTAGVLGHRQVTDAYLAQLARHHAGRLATFDAGLAAIHADVATLLPVTAPVSAPRA